MRKFILRFIVLSLVISNFGCTTIQTLSEKESNNKVYSGTIRQVELACGHAVCIDFPFSLVADTLMLPVTIPWSIYNVATGQAEKHKQSEEKLN